jgi:ketosteroid isomerase-like protein
MQPQETQAPLTKAEVEATVHAYWKASTGKRAEEQAAFYAENAVIFATSSKRLEPARLVLLRRQREYLAGATEMKVQLGNIDVELLSPYHAVAVYTIQLDAQQVSKPSASGQKEKEEHLQDARVTHVFCRDHDGTIRIVHEHISAPMED